MDDTAREQGGIERVSLYSARGETVALSLDRLPDRIGDDELLWVDIARDDAERISRAAAALGLCAPIAARASAQREHPRVDSVGEQFAVYVVVARHDGALDFRGLPLLIAAGRNCVLTVHPEPIGFLDDLHARERLRSWVGTLSADSFVASLLGWHLESYFEAATDFERHVDRLEDEVLRGYDERRVEDLRRLRRGASRLRHMLAPHRRVFTAVARPDFRPDAAPEAQRHFEQLADRYERAADVIENAREMMIGSFELFSNRIAIQTNATMRTLTFITVVVGLQTVVAGILGMNFDAPFFQTRALGFWIAVLAMAAIAAACVLVGRRRGWF